MNDGGVCRAASGSPGSANNLWSQLIVEVGKPAKLYFFEKLCFVDFIKFYKNILSTKKVVKSATLPEKYKTVCMVPT